MALRAAILIALVAALWPAGIHAEQTSAGEPVALLSCSDVFDGQEVAQAYVDRIVEFAGSARLSKWARGLRILVRSDAPPQDFVSDAINDFRGALPHVEGFDAIAQFDWMNHAHLKDGDLLVYLTWYQSSEREAAEQRLRVVLDDFAGPEAKIEAIVGSESDPPFVGVIRSPEGEIRRAIVVAHLGYLQLGKQPALLELLTSAINPNPGNAFDLGLPGATPEEKRIYEKVWHSQVDYDLRWTREFQMYLRVALGARIPAGATKDEFTKAAREALGERKMKGRLADLYGCQI